MDPEFSFLEHNAQIKGENEREMCNEQGIGPKFLKDPYQQ